MPARIVNRIAGLRDQSYAAHRTPERLLVGARTLAEIGYANGPAESPTIGPDGYAGTVLGVPVYFDAGLPPDTLELLELRTPTP